MNAPGRAALTLLVLVSLASARCSGTRSGSGDEKGAAGAPDAGADASAAAAGSLASIPTTDLRLLYPSPDDDRLHVETRSVVAIASPEDRAKQCLEELFRGPSPGLLAAAPEGTRVLQVYILPNGTAFVDLSAEILKLKGGSATELQTVYAIVDTLALNVAGINRIGILVEGEPRETLGGHVCTQSPLAPDFSYAEEAAQAGAAPAVAGGAPPGEAGGPAAGDAPGTASASEGGTASGNAAAGEAGGAASGDASGVAAGGAAPGGAGGEPTADGTTRSEPPDKANNQDGTGQGAPQGEGKPPAGTAQPEPPGGHQPGQAGQGSRRKGAGPS